MGKKKEQQVTPSCCQCSFRQICEGKASPAQHNYVEKRLADVQRPAAVSDVRVYYSHSRAIRMLLLWLAEVALVLLRLLYGRE